MSNALDDYYEALDRLKKRQPMVVPKGTKITNDAVSLEAGRKKGTIKKSRPIFKDLIEKISAAAEETSSPEKILIDQLSLEKEEVKKYRKLWEEALMREVSLVKQLWSEREAWAAEKSALTGEKVSSILGDRLKANATKIS